MVAPARPAAAIPARQELVAPDGTEDLQGYLRIKPPVDASTTPPSLAFERKRELAIPWREILGSAASRGETSIAALRDYFERSWGWPDDAPIDEARLAALAGGGDPHLRFLAGGGQPPAATAYRTALGQAEAPGETPVKEGVIIRHATSGRWYLLVPTAQAISAADFASPAAYGELWEKKVDGVELVFTVAGEAKAFFTDFSEVDLRPGVIHRAFSELLQQKTFAASVSANVDKVTGNAIAQIVGSGMDTAELERLQERVFRLKLQEYAVDRRLEQLQSQASDLGFYLFLTTQEFTFPDKKKVAVKPGEIYRQYRRTAQWTTSHSRQVKQVSKILGLIPVSKTVTQSYTTPNSQVVTDFARVDTSRDPVADRVSALREQGMQVFLFEQGPAGFVTSDGTALRAVMEQCDRNEAFRRKCVVMLPVLEESLTGQRALTKYSVFSRPSPGISPTTLPRLVIQESLSYRTAWRETRLGELVSTINLAPGEERTVVMTKAFEQETTVTRSSTSIFDVSRSESNDLASEMENQARAERERSSNMQLSAKASGHYGFLTAEATASGGTSTSLKEFGQAISKVARKASQAINQQNREEVSSSSSARTTVSNKDETTAVIRNINQGRTLNLLFYRVQNRFAGGIYVDDLQFEVIPSTEVVAGSGVYEALRFGLGDLESVIAEFQLSRLPFATALDDEAYRNRVVASLRALLHEEYAVEDDSPEDDSPDDDPPDAAMRAPAGRGAARGPQRASGNGARRFHPRSAAILRLALDEPLQVERSALKGAPSSPLAALAAKLRDVTLRRDTRLQNDELLLPSGGLYMDTVVGALPATEPYSERMRAQEVRMRAAEVLVKQADAEYQQALARRIGNAGGGDHADGNWLTGIYPDAENKTLRLRLKAPLAQGSWDVLVDGKAAGRLAQRLCGKKDVDYTWEAPQSWLDGDGLHRRIVLLESQTGATIGYP